MITNPKEAIPVHAYSRTRTLSVSMYYICKYAEPIRCLIALRTIGLTDVVGNFARFLIWRFDDWVKIAN